MGWFRRLVGLEERASSPYPYALWQKDFILHGNDRHVYGFGPRTEGVPNDFDMYASKFYKGSGVVFAVANKRMMTFSQITFKWRPLDSPSVTHSLFGSRDLAILENPWPGGKTGDLLARAIQDVDLAGNFYAVREYDTESNRPRLRRLRPDWVDIVLTEDPDRAVKSDVVGYRYYAGGYGTGIVQDYAVEEVCHWAPIPDPQAQYRGMSWLTPVINDILVDQGASQHKVGFFRRGAQLSTVFMLDKGVTREQLREFRDEMLAGHAGANNSHKPLFLGGGVDVKVLEVDLSKMDLKTISGTAETHIAAAAGVHPTVVGLSEGLNGSSLNAGNYKVANRGFINGTLHPLWQSLCDALENVVDKPTGSRSKKGPVRLWYSDADVAALNDDRKEKSEIMTSDATTINALIREGWKPDSVKKFVISGNIDDLEHSNLVSVQLYEPGKVPGADDKGSVGANQDKAVVKDPTKNGGADDGKK